MLSDASKYRRYVTKNIIEPGRARALDQVEVHAHEIQRQVTPRKKQNWANICQAMRNYHWQIKEKIRVRQVNDNGGRGDTSACKFVITLE